MLYSDWTDSQTNIAVQSGFRCPHIHYMCVVIVVEGVGVYGLWWATYWVKNSIYLFNINCISLFNFRNTRK